MSMNAAPDPAERAQAVTPRRPLTDRERDELLAPEEVLLRGYLPEAYPTDPIGSPPQPYRKR